MALPGSVKLRFGHIGCERKLEDLFRDTFTKAEGADEGRLIGAFVSALLGTTPPDDLRVFSAWDAGELIGAIAFSRLRYPSDPRAVFILSPVAVRSDQQGEGIGQALIAHGIQVLRDEGSDCLLTYGDPAYYLKSGFHPISESFAAAPLTLSMPQGWLGQPLTEAGKAPYSGTPACVTALKTPALW